MKEIKRFVLSFVKKCVIHDARNIAFLRDV